MRQIKLLCLDVDGVLTDGTIAVGDSGQEFKFFNARDGLGIRLWLRLGGQVAVITGRAGVAARHRLNELGVRMIYTGSNDKLRDFRAVLAATGLTSDQAAFVGDDLPDLPPMRACGYPVAVHDAAPEVRAAARHVTTAPGGCGAVREAVEHLLRGQERWKDALALFDEGDGRASARHEHERPASS